MDQILHLCFNVCKWYYKKPPPHVPEIWGKIWNKNQDIFIASSVLYILRWWDNNPDHVHMEKI